MTTDVLALLISANENRRRLAVAMLNAHAANALPNPLSAEDIIYWQSELNESEAELVELRQQEADL